MAKVVIFEARQKNNNPYVQMSVFVDKKNPSGGIFMQFVVEVFFWLQIDGSQERYLFTNKMEVIVGKVGFALRGTVETRLIL